MMVEVRKEIKESGFIKTQQSRRHLVNGLIHSNNILPPRGLIPLNKGQ